jgi:hypothetical protein
LGDILALVYLVIRLWLLYTLFIHELNGLCCHASHISRGVEHWGVETLMALVQAESDPSWSYSLKALGGFAALASAALVWGI